MKLSSVLLQISGIDRMDAVDPLELQSAVFGEEYYAEEEVEDGKLVEKPQFGDLEEELAALSSKDKQGTGLTGSYISFGPFTLLF